MKVCTFIGHRDTTEEIRPFIKQIIISLVNKENISDFYVGNHGNFDRLVYSTLKEISAKYDNINYDVVLAYLPKKKDDIVYKNTIYPEGIELVPQKFAISFRNKWMIKNSDIVIAYVNHNYGGAAQFLKYAENQKKRIINIADIYSKKLIDYS